MLDSPKPHRLLGCGVEGIKIAPNLEPHRLWSCGVKGVKIAPNLEPNRWWSCGVEGVFVCVEVLRPSQPNGVMSSAVSLPNHTFTGQA